MQTGVSQKSKSRRIADPGIPGRSSPPRIKTIASDERNDHYDYHVDLTHEDGGVKSSREIDLIQRDIVDKGLDVPDEPEIILRDRKRRKSQTHKILREIPGAAVGVSLAVSLGFLITEHYRGQDITTLIGPLAALIGPVALMVGYLYSRR